jgi:hypothetical protein
MNPLLALGSATTTNYWLGLDNKPNLLIGVAILLGIALFIVLFNKWIGKK